MLHSYIIVVRYFSLFTNVWYFHSRVFHKDHIETENAISTLNTRTVFKLLHCMMPFLNSWTCIVAHCVHWSWCWPCIRSICDAANPVKVCDIKLSSGKEHESPWSVLPFWRFIIILERIFLTKYCPLVMRTVHESDNIFMCTVNIKPLWNCTFLI
jgi:hypothetical protein